MAFPGFRWPRSLSNSSIDCLPVNIISERWQQLFPVGLHVAAALPGPGPVGASRRGLTQTPLHGASWAPREWAPLPGRLYSPWRPPWLCPPTASLNVILTAVPDEGAPGHGWHCCEQVQKQTLVCFTKIKGFYSALAWGSLPTPLEWSGWGRRGDRSHPLGEEAPPFWVFAGRAAPVRARWPWIIPGVSVPQTLCSSRRVSPARERGLHPGRSKRRTSFAHRPQDPTR